MLRNGLFYYLEIDLLTVCTSANPFVGIKNYCQNLLKTRSKTLAMKRHRESYSVADLIAYAFVGVFLSDTNFLGVFKQIMQCDLLKFAVVPLLVFSPLFNAQRSMF